MVLFKHILKEKPMVYKQKVSDIIKYLYQISDLILIPVTRKGNTKMNKYVLMSSVQNILNFICLLDNQVEKNLISMCKILFSRKIRIRI